MMYNSSFTYPIRSMLFLSLLLLLIGSYGVAAAVTPEPTLYEHTLQLRVNHSLDDAEEIAHNGPVGEVYTHSSDLEIGYNNGNRQIVGIRYPDVTIPSGASILEARLTFVADEADSGDDRAEISAEVSPNSARFSNDDFDLSSRDWRFDDVDWYYDTDWVVGESYTTPDMRLIVQQVVDQPGWVAGNAMSFMLTGVYVRVADSYDGNPDTAPLLTVRFLAPYPPTQIFETRISNGYNDAEEIWSDGSGDMSRSSSDLELGFDGDEGQLVGMRFKDVTIPAGSTITHAYIEFTADESHSGHSRLEFYGEATGSAEAFSGNDYDISNRLWGDANPAWYPDEWQRGNIYRSVNLFTLIQEIIDHPDWESGNDMAVFVFGTGTRTAESYNGDADAAPLLHIKYAPPSN